MGFKDFYNKGLDLLKFETKGLNTFHPHTYSHIGTGTASWISLNNYHDLKKCYETNPIASSALNLLADYFSNIKYLVKDLKTGELTPLNEYKYHVPCNG